MRVALGVLLALILLAGAAYYLDSRDADHPHVANGSGTNQTESSPAAKLSFRGAALNGYIPQVPISSGDRPSPHRH
jgi:hypothetical protein